jgi:hypothetical protein
VRWTLPHPDDPTVRATYGFDPERGVWAELEYCGVVVVHDRFEIDFDGERPVRSVLRFLSEYGFLRGDEVDAALENCRDGNFQTCPHGWPCGRRRAPGRRVRRVIAVISNLESATG